jgi:hypothetical protein
MPKERKPEEMTEDELAQADGEPLPDRQAMTLIRGVHPLPEPVFIDPGAGGYTIDPPPPDDV